MSKWKVPTDQGEVLVEAEDAKSAAAKATAGDILGFVDGQGPKPDVSRAESAGRGGLQGATFGYADELFGGMMQTAADQQVLGLRDEGINIQNEGMYGRERDKARAANDLARQANPGTYFMGELAGGMAVPGAGALGAGKFLPKLSKYGQMSAGGAAMGTIAGGGYSEADTAGGVAGDMAIGAGIGGIAAPAIGLAGAGIRNVGGMAGDLFKNTFLKTPKTAAQDRVRTLLEHEGIDSADSLAGRVAGMGDDARVADVLPFESELVSQMPGGGNRIMRGALDPRQAGQQGRLAQGAQELLPEGQWGGGYYKYLDDINTRLKETAGPLYTQARDKGFAMTKEIAALFQKPSMQKALKKAQVSILDELDSPLGAPQKQGTMSLNIIDQTLKELQDGIKKNLGKAPEKARRLIKLKKELERMIYAQNPAYQAARKTWAGGKQLESAAELGKDILARPKLFEEDIVQLVEGFSKAERQSFQTGLIQGVMNKVRNAGETHNAINKLANNERMRGVLNAAFGTCGDEAAEKFLKLVDDETILNATYALTRGGSRTARTLNQRGDVGVDAGTAASAAAGEPLGIIAGVLRSISRNMKEPMSPEEATEVAKLLVMRGGGAANEASDIAGIFSQRVKMAMERAGVAGPAGVATRSVPGAAASVGTGMAIE